jgi:hypothetical protein
LFLGTKSVSYRDLLPREHAAQRGEAVAMVLLQALASEKPINTDVRDRHSFSF